MNCEAAREGYVEALGAGRAAPEAVARHVMGCPACQEATRGLAAAWAALAALPLLEPDPALDRRIKRRLGRAAARDTLASVEAWQRAAFVGVVGFVLSVLLGLAVPYETMVAVCQRLAPGAVPTPVAYLMAGLLYGVLPMAVGTAVVARARRLPGWVGMGEGPLVFVVALLPYLVLRCEGFPPALFASFAGGIGLGAIAGGGVGAWLGRQAWSHQAAAA